MFDPSCHPQISQCARIQKKQRRELATPKNGRDQNLPPLNSPELGTLPFLGVASPELSHFRGWPVQDSCFFSGFWHIGKFGGGKKDQTPCTKGQKLFLEENIVKNQSRSFVLISTDMGSVVSPKRDDDHSKKISVF